MSCKCDRAADEPCTCGSVYYSAHAEAAREPYPETTVELREGSVQAAVLAYLGQRGDCFFWRQNTGGAQLGGQFVRFGIKGASDVFAIMGPSGRFVAIECKRPKGGVESKAQRQFGESVRAVGGIYVLARSVADVVAALPPVAVRAALPQRKRVYPR